VTVDLAVGELAFVDLTFVGLDAVPAPGEERHARDVVRSPGGAAITAVGAARLGLSAAVASPLGSDAEGDFLRGALAAEGVRWAGRRVARTALTAVLPAAGERAMATYEPGEQVHAAELEALAPAAVVLSLPRLALAPSGAAVYATAGDAHARRGELPAALEDARALLVNEREALLLSGAPAAHEAARRLAAHAPCAVVTRGPHGAVAAAGEDLVEVPGVAADAVDTTGAGDLFAAAYAWADARGLGLEERLSWAVLYASLSVSAPTAVAGAVRLNELVAAGRRAGLAPPAPARSVITTRRHP
jgi:sugar/nucleoside kinase (ribokinase family)